MRRHTRRIFAVLIGALIVSSSAGAAQSVKLDGEKDAQPASATLAIVGGLLIDGHDGPPVHRSVVLVDGNKIVAVGTIDTLKVPAGAKVIDAGGMTVMPGLIDAHVHLDIIGHGNYAYWHKTYFSRYQEIMATSSRQLLLSGVTTVNDLCGQPESLIVTRKKIESGEMVGPRIRASMGWISNWPDEEWKGSRRETFTWNSHTAEGARTDALKVLSYGADTVKVHNGLTQDQMKAITEEAHKKGLRVTGHTGSKQDVLMRINAGQDAIEHLGLGSGAGATIDREVVQALVDHRTYVTPTLIQSMIQIEALESPGWIDNQRAKSTTPPSIWADIYRSLAHPERLEYFGSAARVRSMRQQEAKFKQLLEAGVRMNVGTDGGTPYNFQTDAVWQEMELMVRYGMPPMEVIAAATRQNAEYLRMGKQVGTITPGKLADVIVVDGNPLLTMRDLRHIAAVVKDGKVYKGTAVDSTVRPSTNSSSPR